MNKNGPRTSRRLLLVNLAWSTALVIVLAVGYVLSYPFALKHIGRYDIPAYRPVQYLIDKTSFGRPMPRWGALCGLREDAVLNASSYRRFDAGDLPSMGARGAPSPAPPGGSDTN